MRENTWFLVAPICAVLAGATAALVHDLLEPGPHAHQAHEAVDRDSWTRLHQVLERLDQRLATAQEPAAVELARAVPPAASGVVARSEVGAQELESLEQLIERVEAVERRLAERVLSTAGTDSDVLLDRTRPSDMGAIHQLLSFQEDDEKWTQVTTSYQLFTLRQVLEEFGRPTKVWGNDGGMSLVYGEGSKYLTFQIKDGYVINVY